MYFQQRSFRQALISDSCVNNLNLMLFLTDKEIQIKISRVINKILLQGNNTQQIKALQFIRNAFLIEPTKSIQKIKQNFLLTIYRAAKKDNNAQLTQMSKEFIYIWSQFCNEDDYNCFLNYHQFFQGNQNVREIKYFTKNQLILLEKNKRLGRKDTQLILTRQLQATTATKAIDESVKSVKEKASPEYIQPIQHNHQQHIHHNHYQPIQHIQHNHYQPIQHIQHNLYQPIKHMPVTMDRISRQDQLINIMNKLSRIDNKTPEYYLRSCLSNKHLLFLNRLIQIGVITELNGTNQLIVQFYLTNLHSSQIKLEISTQDPDGVLITQHLSEITLPKGQQAKFQAMASISYKGPKRLPYSKLNLKTNQFSQEYLIYWPICYLKFLRKAPLKKKLTTQKNKYQLSLKSTQKGVKRLLKYSSFIKDSCQVGQNFYLLQQSVSIELRIGKQQSRMRVSCSSDKQFIQYLVQQLKFFIQL